MEQKRKNRRIYNAYVGNYGASDREWSVVFFQKKVDHNTSLDPGFVTDLELPNIPHKDPYSWNCSSPLSSTKPTMYLP